jgi:hypothetical protein
MATGQFTGFPINWSDSLAAFGLVPASGGAFTGPLGATTVYVGAPPAINSDFYVKQTWSNRHGHYAFVDDTIASWTEAPGAIWGHASFNVNIKLTTAAGVPVDHHHSFQSYPQVQAASAGTFARISGMYSVGDHSGSGNVAEWSGYCYQEPTGTGPIAVQCAVKIEPMTRGTAGVYGIYSPLGNQRNLFSGGVDVGPIGQATTIRPSGEDTIVTPSGSGRVKVRSILQVEHNSGIRILDAGLTIGGSLYSGSSATRLASDGDAVVLMTSGQDRFRAEAAGALTANGPLRFGQYTLATLPSAASTPGYCIEVSNATGGPKICRSNGSVWQILNTATTVS